MELLRVVSAPLHLTLPYFFLTFRDREGESYA